MPTAPGAVVFSALLPDVEQEATALRNHLAQMQIDRWKTSSTLKRQAEGDARSLDRNLAGALPGMIQQVRSAPSDLAAGFKLYRDLNALYEVLSSLAQSAGMFAAPDESGLLVDDVSKLDSLRRSLADRLEGAALAQQAQIGQLQSQIRSLTVAAATPPPRKIVVDDDQPAPEPAKRKKPAPSKPKNPQEKQ